MNEELKQKVLKHLRAYHETCGDAGSTEVDELKAELQSTIDEVDAIDTDDDED